MKTFKVKEVNDAYSLWASNHPESHHECDRERFVDFVICALKNGESVEYNDIEDVLKGKMKPKELERMSNSYMGAYDFMELMYEKLT
jgi:hypothetical protein